MAGKGVNFLSGPRLRISLNGNTVGFAIGLNISVSVNIAPVMVLGQYNTSSLEPVAYAPIRGSIVLVKAKTKDDDALLQNPDDKKPFQSTLSAHLDPNKVLLSETFDLDLKVDVIKQPAANASEKFQAEAVELLKIYDCRLTSHSNAITVGQALNDSLSFEGLLALDRKMMTGEGASANATLDTPSMRLM
jgi:hypothetical protein